uniref:Uncharacterized protein n=1 Tax=Anguilla anguilla TaxID=7936 RepID=A0A0E9WV79_ANGAN
MKPHSPITKQKQTVITVTTATNSDCSNNSNNSYDSTKNNNKKTRGTVDWLSICC